MSERADGLDIAVDDNVALEHHSAQLLVLLAGLDLQAGARFALQVAHLLGDGICPGPDLRSWSDALVGLRGWGARARTAGCPQHIPKWHQMRPASRPRRGAGHSPLFRQE